MKKNFSVKKFTWIYGALLGAAVTYVLLDSFVIPHRYQEEAVIAEAEDVVIEKNEESENAVEIAETAVELAQESKTSSKKSRGKRGRKSEQSTEENTEETQTDNSAEKSTESSSAQKTESSTAVNTDGIEIEIQEYRVDGTDIHVAEVTLPSAEYLKTALAEGTYGRNIKATTSQIAEENNAILAINGDFYGSRQAGYVIRNGVLYRSVSQGAEDLVIYKDGSMAIIDEDEVSAEELLEAGAMQVLSFGPALLEDGEIAVDANDEVGRAKSSNPRTAIGIIDELHYVFVVSDGRTDENEGLSLMELAEFMESLGVTTAYNLDGGGSSTMVYQGEVINTPTTSGNNSKERSVSDIVYIG